MAPLFERDTTTVRIPRQRRFSRQAPVVVVLPQELTWKQRAAYAIGRAMWKRRRALLPALTSLTCFLATVVAHHLAPWLWAVLAFVAVAGPGWLVWIERRRPSAGRRVRMWRYGLAALVMTAGAWAAASVAYGPTAGLLPLLWLLLTIAAHVTWRTLRRPTPAPAAESFEKEPGV
ncbi:hypothetical protein [Streptomyces albireticuli]|nr:hypothetical protein [Streptomyces albireticuli]